MDGPRFDRLTRELVGGRSRRSVVKGLAGGLGAGAVALVGGRSTLGHHDPDHCAQEGEKAKPKKGCCTGLTEGANGRCRPQTCDEQCAGCAWCVEKADGSRECASALDSTACEQCSSDTGCPAVRPHCVARLSQVGGGASFSPCPTSFPGPACVGFTPCRGA